MERRLKPVRLLSFAFLAAALVACIPWLGPWTLPLLAIALAGFIAIDRALTRARRPEYLVAGAWVLSVSMITVACLNSGAVNSPALPWLAIPAVTLPARFRPAVVGVGSVLTVIVILAISFGSDPSGTWGHPVHVVFDVALVGSVVGFTLALMRSDLEHRSNALIDPLTGMLNRHALKGRIAELTAQAQVNHEPIAVILADLDHFKAINDEHGHEAGDAVLTEAAVRLRSELRAYDLAYRLGGEEFLVVMPGAGAATAETVAEMLRRAVSAGPINGIDVTVSLGVSAASADELDFERLLASADAALYRAKRSGRDRVCGQSDAVVPLAASA
jgi:diguanylate cyclase (GGDEF)-like protein